MTDDIDFESLFEGLDPEVARALADRIRAAVQDFAQADAMPLSNDYWKARKAVHAPLEKKPQAKPSRSVAEIDAELESNAAQLAPMLKQPSQFRSQRDEIGKRQDELFAERAQAMARQQQAEKASRAPQIEAVDGELGKLVQEFNQLKTFPTKHKARLNELSEQIAAKSQEMEGLQNG